MKDFAEGPGGSIRSEEKIRIVLEGLRGEDGTSELCRREGIVGWSRRNFMLPLPRFATWDDFNA